MAADIKETKFIEDVLRKSTQIITGQEELHAAVDIFGDRSYSADLDEDDFTEYGLTKAQFTDIADFETAFNLFLDGQAHAVKDYRKILNILRTDK